MLGVFESIDAALADAPPFVPVAALPRLLERLTGLSVHRDSIRRWRAAGLINGHGERVVLQSVRIGKRIFIPRDAIAPFVCAMTGLPT